MPQFTRTRFRLLFMLLLAGLILSFVPAMRAHAERPIISCDPSEIHPIWWKARNRYDVKVTIQETGQTRTIRKWTAITLVSFNRSGPKTVMLADGTHCTMPANAIKVLEDRCTKGDYSTETKTRFVNSRDITSKTDYMIWVSTNVQSLNIFKGSNRNWTLIKSYSCSTGMADWETPIGMRSIVAKMKVCHSQMFDSNLINFLSFGGSGIHKWPGGGMTGKIGVKPCSHACVRLSKSASLWTYNHIPVGTRLFVY